MVSANDRIYHLALSGEWDAAKEAGGPYASSTIGVSLAEAGFVHCSFRDQVKAVADRSYMARNDVVLLVIDPALLDAEVRVEASAGSTDEFPHVYGPIPLDAVAAAVAVPQGGYGYLRVNDVLATLDE